MRNMITRLAVAVVATTTLGATVAGQPAAAKQSEPPAKVSREVTFGPRGTARVIVGLRAPAKNAAAIAAAQDVLLGSLRGTKHSVVRQFDVIPYVALEVGRDAIKAIERNPTVTSVSADGVSYPALKDSAAKVRATETFANGSGGAGTVVAVLDTGFSSQHRFTSTAGMWGSSACFADQGDCPNGQTSQIGTGAAECVQSHCDHGTHVAGITAGWPMYDDSTNIHQGMAPEARILPVRVFNQIDDKDSCEPRTAPCMKASDSDILAGMQHVYGRKLGFWPMSPLNVVAVNLSLGSEETYGSRAECDQARPALRDMVRKLRDVGVATVAASGNQGETAKIASPACVTGAISVGVTTKDDVPFGGNVASFLDFVAPGAQIRSSILANSWGEDNGTSMAAPHVAGAVAVLRGAFPTATVTEVVNALRVNSKAISGPNGLTLRRIDIKAARDRFGVESVDTTVWETAGTVRVDFRLPYAAPRKTVLQWNTRTNTPATSPSDFTASSGTVTIPAGAWGVSVYVQIIEDTAAESDEFFIVEIKATEGVPVSKSMGKVTILDNDRPKSSPGGGSYGGWA